MSIRRLARELELSIGTVSRALNDRPDVNDATRARVKAAAAAAGYEPNQSGRSLRKGCTGMVAAVVPTSTFAPQAESIIGKVFEGVRRTLHGEGVDLMMLFRGPHEDPLATLQRTVSRRIADAIILTQTARGDARVACLRAAGTPFVAFGRIGGSEDLPWADFDFEAAAAEAAQRFAGDGHRRAGLVLTGDDLNYNHLLRARFRAEAEAAGLEVVEFVTRDYRLSEADAAALAEPGAPSAFLVGNETIAARLYPVLAAAGRPVGAGSAVVSALPALNPTGLAPALTSFEADLDALGCVLGRQLLAVLPGVEGCAAPRPSPAPAWLAARGSETAWAGAPGRVTDRRPVRA